MERVTGPAFHGWALTGWKWTLITSRIPGSALRERRPFSRPRQESAGFEPGHAGHFDHAGAEHVGGFDGGSGRVATGLEELSIGPVHLVKMCDAGEVHIRSYDALHTKPKLIQHLTNRPHHCACFLIGVTEHRLSGRKVGGHQTGEMSVTIIDHDLD